MGTAARDPLYDPTHETQVRALFRRHLTRAGNVVNRAVTLAATTLTYTLPLSEEDTGYGVTVTPNWNTTVWVTGKTTTQCTVHFGNAAPVGAIVDIDTFRQL